MSSDLNPKVPQAMDLAALRAKLAQEDGKRFWQSLEELSETKEYREFLENEFPHDPEKDPQGMNRRDVLKLAAASAALAGLSACTKLPTQKIVPYVKAPEEIVAGKPLFYATSMPLAGVACGPSGGKPHGAAHEDRRQSGASGQPGRHGRIRAGRDAGAVRSRPLANCGAGRPHQQLGRVSDRDGERESGNCCGRQRAADFDGHSDVANARRRRLGALLKKFPAAKWHQYEPCGRDNSREGARLAFGKPVNTVYRIEQADVIVSLDADFVSSGPGHVRYARDFSSRRVIEGTNAKLNRLYVVESMPSSTGAVADHRKALRAGDVEAFARELAAAAGVAGVSSGAASSKIPAEWTRAVAKDLAAASRQLAGDCRRRAAARGARAGARDECGAGKRRQDRVLHGRRWKRIR